MANRNASPMMFGIEYQIDAGIYIYINKIKEIKEFRVEGKFEDIEIVKLNDDMVFIQVKSTYSTNNKKTFTKFRKAVEGFSYTLKQKNGNIAYCSNQEDKLIGMQNISLEEAQEIKWEQLNEKVKIKVKKYFEDYGISKDQTLDIIYIPYINSNDMYNKKKVIIDKIKELLLTLNVQPYYSRDLIDNWHSYFKHTASHNSKVDKNTFLTYIILIIINKYFDAHSSTDINNVYRRHTENNFIDFHKMNKLYQLFRKSEDNDIKRFIENHYNNIRRIIAQSALKEDDYKTFIENLIKAINLRQKVFNQIESEGLL